MAVQSIAECFPSAGRGSLMDDPGTWTECGANGLLAFPSSFLYLSDITSRSDEMAFWLLKTEPSTYAFADLVRDGKTRWDGVSNNLALKNIRMMSKGDLVFLYHTGDEKSIVGIAEVVSSPYADPRAKDPRLVVVDIRARSPLKNPIPLSTIKQRKAFSDFALVRLPRLSVIPVSDTQWKLLLELAQ